ncbi:YsnF/AvaK domain-containing protein [Peribacillus saganii]|uniref:YsnF/AvaK domain-containing protein n=1 Tax=Peribacillus saganii TaxID=2303992 RepID=A0A372LPJ2_9BACI|nr:YsnF/AvaK domain-containing protein [Peribacillus saganii]RFU69017.1 YsnF/AvaK domain-containing protein [Peribacillus saganii]
MNRQIVGVYETAEEAIKGIEALTSKGYDASDLSVITNREDVFPIESRTGASVDGPSGSSEHLSLMDKIKNSFMMDNEKDARERLMNYGISEKEVSSYATDLDNDKILVAVDSGVYSDKRPAANTYDTYSDMSTDAALGSSTFNTDSSKGMRANSYGTNADRGLDSLRATFGTSRNPEGVNEYAKDTEIGTDEEKTMKLREEQLKVNKQAVQTGEVQVNKEVVEEQKSVEVPVKHEEVYVERRPAQSTAADAGTIDENETIRVPVVEEQIQVTKKPVVTEEIVIGKRTVEETKHVSDTVKKEEAHVDKEKRRTNGTLFGDNEKL